MTDDEILFDFFTVEERHRMLQEAQEPWREEQGTKESESTIDLLPDTKMPARNSSTSVTADREEFIRWYEAEVGPWIEMR